MWKEGGEATEKEKTLKELSRIGRGNRGERAQVWAAQEV